MCLFHHEHKALFIIHAVDEILSVGFGFASNRIPALKRTPRSCHEYCSGGTVGTFARETVHVQLRQSAGQQPS